MEELIIKEDTSTSANYGVEDEKEISQENTTVPPVYDDAASYEEIGSEDMEPEPRPEPKYKITLSTRQRIDMLNKFLINSQTELPEVQPIISVNDIIAFAAGDLMAIKAKPKNGKTTTLKLMTAAMMNGYLPPLECDQEGCRVLWFDTEEGLRDVKKIVEDVHQISGMPYEYIDSHLRVYTFRTQSYKTILEDIETLIKGYHPYVVIIDGIVDLVSSFNDEVQSHNLISELIRIAEEYKCAICCVLHENKTSDNHNMRGHLGTILQQKATTVFQCVMKDGVITVSCADARHKPIPEWHIMYDENGHIVCADMPDGDIDSPSKAKNQHRLDTIKTIIQEEGGSIARNELTARLEVAFNLKRTTVSNMITALIKNQTLSDNGDTLSWQLDLFDQEESSQAN